MTEKKIISSFGKQYCKKEKIETEKVNKSLANIPTGYITELNELIYAGEKLLCDKIGVPLRNLNRNTKPGCKISWLIKKKQQSESNKKQKTHKNIL